jgi:predicted esterase
MVRASIVVWGVALCSLGGCAASSSGETGGTGGTSSASTAASPTGLGGAGRGAAFGAPTSAGSGAGQSPGMTAGTGSTPTAGTTPTPAPGAGTPSNVPGGAGASAPLPGGQAGASGAPAPGMPAAMGAKDPLIPAVSGDCPMFVNGTITLMGVGGIQIVAGTKPAMPTAPMVFYWHGTGGSSGEFAAQAAAIQQAVIAGGGVLVSFQGTTGGDLLSGTAIFGATDFPLADQLVACAVRDHNIDPRRIYATGCSAGGLFSAAMAAERSSYIAAAGTNSGGWVLPVTWQNDHTPALMTVHGAMGTDVVIVDFATTSQTADDAFKARGGFVIDCNTGGGHCGGGGLAGDIWKFFQAHTFGVSPEPWSALPAGFSSFCKIQ